MAEDGNKKPSVRKLTVDNFSVIKHAELEFGQITVLIGPQASGKSLLCKLAYFLGKEVLDAAVSSATSGVPFEHFREQAELGFAERFPPLTAISRELRIEYSVSDNWVRVSSEKPRAYPYGLEFCDQFVSIYNSALENRPDQELAVISKQNWQEVWYFMFRALFSGAGEALEFFFVPAGRSLFADPSTGLAALQNTELDPLLRLFSAQVSWNGNWRVGLVSLERNTQQEIRKKIRSIAGGEVTMVANKPLFRSRDGRQIAFSLLSSGTQELLPMLNVLERLAGLQEHREALNSVQEPPPIHRAPTVHTDLMIFLEEPELSLFPRTQYELVQLYSWLCRDPVLRFNWAITTHSPYILSSFNNLIFAGQLGRDERLKKRIKIDEKYWIKPGSFKAYSIHDGKSESILSESGLINGEYLDSVSESIGEEFDSLLRLEYENSKAS